jgi:hypothetical protein
MKLKRLFVLLTLAAMLLLMGNLPAPYYACEGKAPGDSCTYGYGCRAGGKCALTEDCKDDPGTTVNECLICQTR